MSGEGAHRTLKQTLAWIADRNLDRVNTAYREWRDCYYEYPQLSDWRSKPPLIWDWRSPVDELDGAAQALRRKCESGALHGTGREGASTPRREIAPLRWPDLMLVDIAGTTAGPQLYDSNAGSLAIMDGKVEPVFHDVLFDVAELVQAFPRRTPFQLAGLTETIEPVTPVAPAKVTPVEADEPTEVSGFGLQAQATEMLKQLFSNGLGSEDTYPVLLEKLAGKGVNVSSRHSEARPPKRQPITA